MDISKYIEKKGYSLSGKTVAISGSTGGLGRELCYHFATIGASLILLDRNMKKSEALARELKDKFCDIQISHIEVDMEDISAVKSAAEKLSKMPIDYLLLNAGAYSIPRHKCDTGYDNVFQINFISPYYLARTLLPHLRERGGKVIAVGSIAHRYSKTDTNDIDFSTRKKASLVYGNAKRYLMFSMFALAENDREIAITHPGITFTNITAHYPKIIFAIIKHPMKIIFMKPKKASLSILEGFFEDCSENEWIGPRFFDVWGTPKKKRLRSCSKEEIKRIREAADKIYLDI